MTGSAPSGLLAPEHRILIRGPVLLGRRRPLAAAEVEIHRVLGQQPDVLEVAAAPYCVNDVAALHLRAGFEQQPDVLGAFVVERVRQRVRSFGLGAVLQQGARAVGIRCLHE
jgi:hypothetical protein